MNIKVIMRFALTLSIWVGLFCTPLRAQLVGPYGTSPVSFEIDNNGLLFDTGSIGTGTLSLSGEGTRLIWWPGQGAFRAGGVDGDNPTYWDPDNIGQYSTATGLDNMASGSEAIALGYANTSTGSATVAGGYGSQAEGFASIALGFASTASGWGSVALGHSYSSGFLSVALGNGGAYGDYSTAMGNYCLVSGEGSTAMGTSVFVNGNNALSTGYGNHGWGDNSIGGGYGLNVEGYDSAVFGTYNLDRSELGYVPTSTSWVPSDPLFELGNGTSTQPSNALIVYKDGNATLQGVLTVAPGGDIPMYTGN